MKFTKNLLAIFLIIIIPILIFIFDCNLECVFKKVFGLACPGCGLTRSLTMLFEGNILLSLYYNILTIPLIIIFLLLLLFLCRDLICNKLTCIHNLNYFITKYYYIIIIILLITMIINNIHEI